MPLFRSSLFRILTALLMLAVWFGASNHCALGLMRTGAASEHHAGCCSHPSKAPARPAKGTPVKECCAAILGVLPTIEKGTVPPAADDAAPKSCDTSDSADLLVARSCDRFQTRETGPPNPAPTFAEAVLQESLLSHAPPLSA